MNQADGRGITPLGLAVGYNKLDVVKALIGAGADVKQADAKGSTSLHYAAGQLCHKPSQCRSVVCSEPSPGLDQTIYMLATAFAYIYINNLCGCPVMCDKAVLACREEVTAYSNGTHCAQIA